MGQKGSSHLRRKSTRFFGHDFDRFENQNISPESDYVSLVRVIHSPNDLTVNNNTINNNIERRAVRPVSTMPNITLSRPKTTLEPNIYCDYKDLMKAKSNLDFTNELPIDEDFDENSLSPSMGPIRTQRPLSYANHCSSRCLCADCRLTRYHLLNWLLPNCTRTNAERLLMGRPDGTFLVR